MTAQYLWQVYNDSVKTWRCIDRDEFDQYPDPARWIVGFPWGDKIFTQRTYVSRQNLKVDSGVIKLILDKSDTLLSIHGAEIDSAAFRRNKIPFPVNGKMPFLYSGALLWSKKNYQYGYFELKFRSVAGKEIWPAFWLYGGRPNYEIDFFELKGERPSDLHVDVHCPDGCDNFTKNWIGQRRSYGHWLKLDRSLAESYNVLAAEWWPGFIKWYLNGVLISYAPVPISMPMGLSIGTGIANAEKGYATKNAPVFPSVFSVDYVRIFAFDSVPQAPLIKSHLPALVVQDPRGDSEFQAKLKSQKLINSSPYKLAGNVLTVSLLPFAGKKYQLRVLGATPEKPVKIIIMCGNETVLDREFTGNSEISFSSGKNASGLIQIQSGKQSTQTLIDFR